MWRVKKAWDHVERRLAQYQTVVTAVIANARLMLEAKSVLDQLNIPSRTAFSLLL
jgi:hypothetical protein